MLMVRQSVLSKLSTGVFLGVFRGPIIEYMSDAWAGASFGRFLTLADTAEVLNISVSQASALVRSGELPAIRVGSRGHWRIERSVLESYIEALYEESRRIGLWNQSDFSGLVDFTAAPRDREGDQLHG
jgi:excisionase family DNA binding protein